MLNICNYGASGDGKSLCTAAFAAAIKDAKEKHQAIEIPTGVFVSGTIDLQGVSLYLDQGSVLRASGDINDYPFLPFVHNEMGRLRAFLVNIGYDGVVIDGSGTIDLNGTAFYDTNKRNIPESLVPFNEKQISECTYPIGIRPNQSIFMYQADNVTVRNIKVINSPCWTFSFNECTNVKMLNLTIDTDLNVPNDDGMHFCSCSGVIIEGCNISSGDDCIALSCITNWNIPCENIVITNCILRSCSKALVIGYVYSQVRNVLITNCIIRESNRGLCLMTDTDCGLIENIRVSNMVIDTRIRAGNWWGNGEPVFIMAVKHDRTIPREQKPSRDVTVNIKDVVMNSITCIGENACGIVGKNDNIENLYLNDFIIKRKESENIELKGNSFDFSPGDEKAEVPADCALFIRGTKNIELSAIHTGNLKIIKE
jgi:polygalacturonase